MKSYLDTYGAPSLSRLVPNGGEAATRAGRLAIINWHCTTLIEAPKKARHVRHLTVHLEGPLLPKSMPNFLGRLSRVLTVLPNLKHLIYFNQRRDDDHDISRLFSRMEQFPFSLVSFSTTPLPGINSALNAFLSSQAQITIFHWDDARPPNIPATALPNLHHLATHSTALDTLASQRPISSVRIIDWINSDQLCRICWQLSRSTVQLRELWLCGGTFSLNDVEANFPTLCYLHFERETMLDTIKFAELSVFWGAHSKQAVPDTPSGIAAWTSNCPLMHTVIFQRSNVVTIWHKRHDLWNRVTSPSFFYEVGCNQYLPDNMFRVMVQVGATFDPSEPINRVADTFGS